MELTLFADTAAGAAAPGGGDLADLRALTEALASRGVEVSLRGLPGAQSKPPKGHALVLSSRGVAALRPLLGFFSRAEPARVWPAPDVLRRLATPRGIHQVRRSLERFSGAAAPRRAVQADAARHGLVSLFAFSGIFSHGVRARFDRAAGGPDPTEAAPVFASTYELLYAHHALVAAHARGVVARVDLCRDAAGGIALFGIDVAPSAFAVAHCEECPSRFADTIVRWIQRT